MCNDFQTTSSNCHDFWILILQNIPILSVDKKKNQFFDERFQIINETGTKQRKSL